MTKNSLKTLCIFLSAIFYIISLCLPAAIIPNFETGNLQINYGFELLVFGWFGLISLQLAWLANPFYIVSLISYGSKTSLYLSILAFFFALWSPLLIVQKLLLGFYFWLGSMIILIFGNSLHKLSID
ncbi:hypothetical protein [Legionella gresilensis]|uniref:hypothetical protein n=1 Tax=Legionella gresilensis TaxID=91823 RepID=UPI0010413740|nr:hypothetical protein [Legionella gresilensis]